MKDPNWVTPPEPAFGLPEMTEDEMRDFSGHENHDCHWAHPVEYAEYGCGLCALETANKGLEGIRADLQKISNGG